MRGKFKKLMIISFITSILFLGIGITLLFFTKLSLDILSYVMATVLILNGACNVIDDYKQFKLFFFFDGFTSGLISVILGIIVLSNPNYFTILIPIIIGIWFIINSTFKLRMSLALRDSNNKNWVSAYLLSILTIVSGLCLIFNPQFGALTLTKIIGSITIIYSICDIFGSIIFIKNIKSIAKVFE